MLASLGPSDPLQVAWLTVYTLVVSCVEIARCRKLCGKLQGATEAGAFALLGRLERRGGMGHRWKVLLHKLSRDVVSVHTGGVIIGGGGRARLKAVAVECVSISAVCSTWGLSLASREIAFA